MMAETSYQSTLQVDSKNINEKLQELIDKSKEIIEQQNNDDYQLNIEQMIIDFTSLASISLGIFKKYEKDLSNQENEISGLLDLNTKLSKDLDIYKNSDDNLFNEKAEGIFFSSFDLFINFIFENTFIKKYKDNFIFNSFKIFFPTTRDFLLSNYIKNCSKLTIGCITFCLKLFCSFKIIYPIETIINNIIITIFFVYYSNYLSTFNYIVIKI